MNTKTTAFARRAAVFVAAAGVALGSAFWAADYLRAQYYAAPSGAAATSTGSASLRAAIKRLGTLESASATITFSLFFEGREYPGSGSYAELSSPNRTLRGENYFKLSAALDDSESPYSLNVVCDGRGSKVWNTKTLGNTTSESRIDLEVIDDWQTTIGPSSETALDASDKSATATPGLGGLAGVLRRLESSYRFQDEVERVDAADGERGFA
ncbi:MAG: hypothetical protein HUK22_00580, partial [Thermoguttaceae bacterium]|nr:hypothetical protein [Thermoguttaceae bacterium]